jgi:hypothetical protein
MVSYLVIAAPFGGGFAWDTWADDFIPYDAAFFRCMKFGGRRFTANHWTA